MSLTSGRALKDAFNTGQEKLFIPSLILLTFNLVSLSFEAFSLL